jgi:2-alkenal reductase
VTIALVVGVIGGGAAGGAVGYYLGNRHDDSAQVSRTATTGLPIAGSSTTNDPSATPTAGSGATATPPQSTEAAVSTNSGDLDAAVAKVNPAVVTIENQQQVSNGSTQTAGMGSGFVIDDQGHIVTNNHVVEGASGLNVIFSDGSKATATIVGSDPFQDVAVIKVDGKVPAHVTFGDSSKLQLGQRIVAIGSALGEFRNTVTNGIVGGLDRSVDTGEGYRIGNLVQHDAPINPGNSGGPLIDANGNVVGMNTLVVRGGYGQAGAEGLGFAIAGNTVKDFANQIIANGKINRPYLGVSFRPVSQQSSPGGLQSGPQPVVVVEVVKGSPADQAGLKAGDIVLKIDGVTLDDQHLALNELFNHKPGDTVTLTIQRGDSQSDVKVTLGSRPA